MRFAVESPKTGPFAQKIKALGLSGTVLVVTDKLDDNMFLSSRNLPDVLVLETRGHEHAKRVMETLRTTGYEARTLI